MQPDSMLIADLLAAYRTGLKPTEFMARLLDAIDTRSPPAVWITRVSRENVLAHAAGLERRSAMELPLYGVPFAIKDNIDLEGVPTTAACPDFAYVPAQTAFVVQCLIDAGAIPIGKTNLDQFAAGLVGTRSPYGACSNSFDPAYVSGGSSSGSAVAVALGLVSFALGTDTAGSGRVPAAFNNIVGLKPSRGRLSTRGVVPACRSLDCVSIFAGSTDCAARVLEAAGVYDAGDPYARCFSSRAALGRILGADRLRAGVPRENQLQFYGDREYARLYGAALETLTHAGLELVEIDYAPFRDAAQLLYEGPWIAERYVAIRDFFDRQPESLHPVTRTIISGGCKPSAAAAFEAQYRLEALRRIVAAVFEQVDLVVTPTAPTIFRSDQVLAAPIELNTQLGYYTNYMNLLDLAGVAVPAGFRSDGLPFGITLVGPAGCDEALLALAGRLHPQLSSTVGATGIATPVPQANLCTHTVRGELVEPPTAQTAVPLGFIPLVVCGAHMSGLPLNGQLRERGAYLLRATRTAPVYRLYVLSGGPPQRPGLVRVDARGATIDVEVWAIPVERLGDFVALVPSPLTIGKVHLDDGTLECGFLCEACDVADAQDITTYGGWRAYLERS